MKLSFAAVALALGLLSDTHAAQSSDAAAAAKQSEDAPDTAASPHQYLRVGDIQNQRGLVPAGNGCIALVKETECK